MGQNWTPYTFFEVSKFFRTVSIKQCVPRKYGDVISHPVPEKGHELVQIDLLFKKNETTKT